MGACAMRRYRSARWLPPYPIRHRPPPVRTVVKRGCKATFRVTILWELFRKLRLDVSYLRHPAKLTEGTPPRFLSPSPRVSPPPQPRRRIEAKLLLLLHVVEKGTSPWRRWVERGWVRFRVRDGGGDKGARTSLVSGRRKNCSGVQIIGRCFVYKFSSTLGRGAPFYLPATLFHARSCPILSPHLTILFSDLSPHFLPLYLFVD